MRSFADVNLGIGITLSSMRTLHSIQARASELSGTGNLNVKLAV